MVPLELRDKPQVLSMRSALRAQLMLPTVVIKGAKRYIYTSQ
jgi:hypothetical protein